MSEKKQEFIALGKIGAPWGLKGEAKLQLYNPDSEVLKKTRLVYLKAGFSFQEYKVWNFRKQGAFFVLGLEDYSSPESIKKIQGEEIYVPLASLAPKKKGEVFVHELVGMKVFDEEENFMGEVTALENYGSTDLLNIHHEDIHNSKDYLIPWVPDVIVNVDEKERKIIIRRIEGLLE